VEHLHPDCRLAVFDEISIRHLIRPSFRPASKELEVFFLVEGAYTARARAPEVLDTLHPKRR
jgi:hypothetical protein